MFQDLENKWWKSKNTSLSKTFKKINDKTNNEKRSSVSSFINNMKNIPKSKNIKIKAI